MTTAKTASKAAAKKPAAKTPAHHAPATDAIKLLMQDHKDVKALFKHYQKLVDADAGNDEKEDTARQICVALTAHATAEEEIFYPAARKVLGADDQPLVDEADVEHAGAKDLIAQIEASSPEDDHYDAKVKVLGEYIDHHVKEEEGEMFPKVKKHKLDLEALGAEIAARKEEIIADLTAAA